MTLDEHKLILVGAAVLAAACGGGPRAKKLRPSTVHVGACAEPERDGVLSERPKLRRANRDLDGDRVAETVVADVRLCSSEGNCYWNIFTDDDRSGCQRYVGTVAAAAIDRLPARGEDGFFDLRGWWRFSRGNRMLMQEYRFRQGGYRVVDALLCREQGDDRLLCATEDRRHP